MVTNVIVGKWVMENLRNEAAIQHFVNGVKMCLDDNLEFDRITSMWELDEVSTDFILKQ